MTSGTDPRLKAMTGGAAGYGFDHHQAEWFRPVDGKKQSRGILQKAFISGVIDLADKFGARGIHRRAARRIRQKGLAFAYSTAGFWELPARARRESHRIPAGEESNLMPLCSKFFSQPTEDAFVPP